MEGNDEIIIHTYILNIYKEYIYIRYACIVK